MGRVGRLFGGGSAEESGEREREEAARETEGAWVSFMEKLVGDKAREGRRRKNGGYRSGPFSWHRGRGRGGTCMAGARTVAAGLRSSLGPWLYLHAHVVQYLVESCVYLKFYPNI